MNKLASLVLLLAIISCQYITSSDDPRLGEEFELEFGEQASLENRELSIKFTELLEDSRCPEGVVCVWAGNAKVALQINDQETTLNTYLEPKETTISSFNIALISVSPYPVYTMDFQNEDYVVRLLVTEN